MTQPPVRGVLTPDASTLDSLRKGLTDVQSSLSSLQNDRYAPTNPAIFPNIVSSLAQRSAQPSGAFTKAQDEYSRASKELADYKQKTAEALGIMEGQGVPLEFVQGRQQVLQRQAEAGRGAREEQVTRAAQNLQTALSQQQVEQSALTGAAGLIPEALRYGFAGGGGMSPQNQAQQYAQEVVAGTRTYDDAVKAMGLYGDAGKQFLDTAIRGGSPGFSFAQAQNLAGIQGTVTPDVTYAQQSLQALKGALGGLKIPGQASAFSPLRYATNVASTQFGIGSGATAEVQGTVAEARSALQRALASAKGGTPTDYVAQSFEMLPNSPSAAQVDAAINVLNSLGSIRRNVYGTPGTITGTPEGGSYGGWGSLGD